MWVIRKWEDTEGWREETMHGVWGGEEALRAFRWVFESLGSWFSFIKIQQKLLIVCLQNVNTELELFWCWARHLETHWMAYLWFYFWVFFPRDFRKLCFRTWLKCEVWVLWGRKWVVVTQLDPSYVTDLSLKKKQQQQHDPAVPLPHMILCPFDLLQVKKGSSSTAATSTLFDILCLCKGDICIYCSSIMAFAWRSGCVGWSYWVDVVVLWDSWLQRQTQLRKRMSAHLCPLGTDVHTYYQWGKQRSLFQQRKKE